jgi:hypothetical protein
LAIERDSQTSALRQELVEGHRALRDYVDGLLSLFRRSYSIGREARGR